MRSVHVRHYRPTKTADGEGSNKSLSSVTLMWADVLEDGNQIDMLLDVDDDVQVGDYLLVQR